MVLNMELRRPLVGAMASPRNGLQKISKIFRNLPRLGVLAYPYRISALVWDMQS
jgi:hypothetical protein